MEERFEHVETETTAMRDVQQRGGIVANVKRFDDKLVEIVREHPVGCMIAALSLGYAVGRIVSRHD